MAAASDTEYGGGTPHFYEEDRARSLGWKSPLPQSAFKDAAGNPYTPFQLPQKVTPVTSQPANTTWAKAWNESYRPPVKPQEFTPAQSFVGQGQNFTRQLNPTSRQYSQRVSSGQGNQGNLAHTPDSRPSYFEQRTTDFTGAQSAAPDYARRDAFIDSLNRRLAQYQMQSRVSQAPIMASAPQFDVADLWRQAGENTDFRNPFVLRQRS